MSNPDITFEEKDYNTHVTLRNAMGMEPSQFKQLVIAAKEFIVENEPYFKTTSRNRFWTNGEWRTMAENFTINESRGPQFFSPKRGGFDPDEHLSWPAEKEEVTFLCSCLIKLEVSKHFSSMNAKKRKSGADDVVAGDTSSKKLKKSDKPAVKIASKPATDDDSVAGAAKPGHAKKSNTTTTSSSKTSTHGRQVQPITNDNVDEQDDDDQDEDDQDDDDQDDDHDINDHKQTKKHEGITEKRNAADAGSEDGTEDGDDDASDVSDRMSNSKNGLQNARMHAVVSPGDNSFLQQPAMHHQTSQQVQSSPPFPIQSAGHRQNGNSTPSHSAYAPPLAASGHISVKQQPGGYGPLHYASPNQAFKPSAQFPTQLHIGAQTGLSSSGNITSIRNDVLAGLIPSDDAILQGAGGGLHSNHLLLHSQPSFASVPQSGYSTSQATPFSHSSPFPAEDADVGSDAASNHTVFRVTVIGTDTHEIRYFATRAGQSFNAFFGNVVLRLSGTPLSIASCSCNCEIKIPGGERAIINPREAFVNSVWRSILGPYEASKYESMSGQGNAHTDDKVEVEFR